MSLPAGSEVGHVLAEGRAAHPDVALGDEAIAARLAGRDDLGELRCPADLFLATAAALGDPAALAAVDRTLGTVVPALRSIVAAHERDDVVQGVRARVLVDGGDGGPAIARYAGRGPLRAWLRIAVVRAGLDERRRRPGEVDEIAWLELPATTEDPGLAALRRRCAPAFRAAFEAALAGLPSRDRLLLRQHLLDGVATPELAALHRVHRVTAFRWLADIKQRILAAVRRDLADQLGLAGAELDSVIREVRSGFAPTLERVLATRDD